MAPNFQPLTLYGGVLGPNPSKIAYILTELNLPYESIYVMLDKVKEPEYVAVNPNGRLPTLIDPNTGIKIWESGAIIEYLITEYDHEHKISFPHRSPEDYAARQWLFFQVSGQGPYYGQGMWFLFFHAEKLPSVIERYQTEIKRVSKVLDDWLEGKTWLVGEKYSYADIAFLSWQEQAGTVMGDTADLGKEFPNVQAWLVRIKARSAIKKVMEKTAAKKKEIGMWIGHEAFGLGGGGAMIVLYIAIVPLFQMLGGIWVLSEWINLKAV